jgi:hypothetical protein
MMKWYFPFFTLLFCISCKSLVIDSQINNKEAYRIYRSVLSGSKDYEINHNVDSTYAICMDKIDPVLVHEKHSFIVFDIKNKSVVFQSMKEYNKVEWLDERNVLLVKYLGIEKRDKSTLQQGTSKIKYVLNVISKEISNFKAPNQETL